MQKEFIECTTKMGLKTKIPAILAGKNIMEITKNKDGTANIRVIYKIDIRKRRVKSFCVKTQEPYEKIIAQTD